MRPIHRGYQMSETVQWTTLIVALFVCGLIYLGACVIIEDIRNRRTNQVVDQEIEELGSDLFVGRNQHRRIHLKGWRD